MTAPVRYDEVDARDLAPGMVIDLEPVLSEFIGYEFDALPFAFATVESVATRETPLAPPFSLVTTTVATDLGTFAVHAYRSFVRAAHAEGAGMTRLRSDGRREVADARDATDLFGCGRDADCVLTNMHAGAHSHDREVWAGPDAYYDKEG